MLPCPALGARQDITMPSSASGRQGVSRVSRIVLSPLEAFTRAGIAQYPICMYGGGKKNKAPGQTPKEPGHGATAI